MEVFVVVFILSIVIMLLKTSPVDSIEQQKRYIQRLKNDIMSLEHSKSELEDILREEYEEFNAWQELSIMIRNVGEKNETKEER